MDLSKGQMLIKVLKDREKRFALRQNLAQRGFASISLNFNIPNYPKTSPKINTTFNLVVKELQRYLVANRITLIKNTDTKLNSNCGNFYIQAVQHTYTHKETKDILEKFEQSHNLERLLDVDLFSEKGETISSKKEKKCFLCNHTAYHCMQKQTHNYIDYKQFIDIKTTTYLKKKRKIKVVNFIAEQALKAILFEVATEQKPGLVCPSTNGAHKDMDYFTFLSSSSALASYLYKITKYGYAFTENKIDYSEAIVKLRTLGLEAEETMYKATKNVNTHKGVIFLMGYACFSASVVFSKQNTFNTKKTRNIIKKLSCNLVEEDYEKRKFGNNTHGASCYQKYGKKIAGGARYEAEQGLPLVFKTGLPFLELEKNKTKEQWQKTLQTLLLILISKNNDTNILYRTNHKKLKQVKKMALEAIQCKEKLKKLISYCKNNNISAGGSADILAVSLFFHFIKNYSPNIAIKLTKPENYAY